MAAKPAAAGHRREFSGAAIISTWQHGLAANAVACLRNIMHPVSVARLVMEETPHVMLVGEGALDFALNRGFQKTKLLTQEARKAWETWKKDRKPVNRAVAGHDTIGMLALDVRGDRPMLCSIGYKARQNPLPRSGRL